VNTHHASDSCLPREKNLGRAETVLLSERQKLGILHKRVLLTQVFVEVGYAEGRVRVEDNIVLLAHGKEFGLGGVQVRVVGTLVDRR
jgi:hypothetical protein